MPQYVFWNVPSQYLPPPPGNKTWTKRGEHDDDDICICACSSCWPSIDLSINQSTNQSTRSVDHHHSSFLPHDPIHRRDHHHHVVFVLFSIYIYRHVYVYVNDAGSNIDSPNPGIEHLLTCSIGSAIQHKNTHRPTHRPLPTDYFAR